MKKLVIKSINNYEYFLEDEFGNDYNIIIELYDLKELPKVNDYIYISEKLLREKMISLGPLGSKYGKKINNENDSDIAMLLINNKKVYLQRYYG